VPEPSATPLRRRALIVLAIVGSIGFGGGAIVNQALARLLALPDDAEIPTYADAAPEPGRPTPDGMSTAGQPDGEDAAPGVEHVGAGGPRRISRPTAASAKSYSEPIVRRNIFDSTAVYDPAAAVSDVAGECKSDSNVRLLATIVVDPPEYSSALISTGSSKDGKADGYGIGDDVGGAGKITLIEQKKVCLDGGGCICMGGDSARPTTETTATGDATEGVEKLADNKYAVDSSLMDEAMNNFESLATQVRVVAHKGADGAVDGYRLSAIRRGSLFDKLGIKNGDIVHGVNGQALTSTEGALSTYQTLRSEKAFSFDITRRNQRQTLEYEVR
jgi:general secretion pathway protein C